MTRQSRSQHYRSKQVLFSGSKRKREYGLGKKTKKRKPRKPKKNENKKSKRRKSARRPRQPSGFRVSRGGAWSWNLFSKGKTNKVPELTVGRTDELKRAYGTEEVLAMQDAEEAGELLTLAPDEEHHDNAKTVNKLTSMVREKLKEQNRSDVHFTDDEIKKVLTITDKINGNPDMDKVVIGLNKLRL